MIVPSKPSLRSSRSYAWQRQFVAMLPTIVSRARAAFRMVGDEAREEAVQNVVANSLVAFVRLVESGKADLAYPTVLAKFGIRQTLDHRRVGGHLRVRDVLSEHAQTKKRFRVERLDTFDCEEDCWREVLVRDRHAEPAEVAIMRIDFDHWMRSLPPRLRKVARALGTGERTGAVAKRFQVSPGRISQIRAELHADWRQFQGEAITTTVSRWTNRPTV